MFSPAVYLMGVKTYNLQTSLHITSSRQESHGCRIVYFTNSRKRRFHPIICLCHTSEAFLREEEWEEEISDSRPLNERHYIQVYITNYFSLMKRGYVKRNINDYT